ncbi:MAG: cytochrome c3 family protein [Candidatus Neomarinimicrobiota bacterium]
MTNVNRSVIVILLFLLILTMLGLASFREPELAIQPLLFSHNLHIEEMDLQCGDCHTEATRRARATFPTTEACTTCHDDPLTETETEAQLLAYTHEDREIPWQRIYMVPDHVYFSHRRHVTLGNVPCETCHGNIRSMTEPLDRPLIPVSMDRCMDCHEEHQVTNDCLSCHR